MGVFEMIFGIVFIGIVSDTVLKISKSKGSNKELSALKADVEELKRQVQEQNALLTDADADLVTYASQLEEMQQRLDFAERLLAQNRNRQITAGPEH